MLIIYGIPLRFPTKKDIVDDINERPKVFVTEFEPQGHTNKRTILLVPKIYITYRLYFAVMNLPFTINPNRKIKLN